jgi:hypothetical protein
MVKGTPRPLSPWERTPLSIKYEEGWAPEPVYKFWRRVIAVGIPEFEDRIIKPVT